jgi:hypothetical protein
MASCQYQTDSMTLDGLISIVQEYGFTPSCGCWESDHTIHAFSVESYGASTYGAPKMSVSYSKETKWVQVIGLPRTKTRIEYLNHDGTVDMRMSEVLGGLANAKRIAQLSMAQYNGIDSARIVSGDVEIIVNKETV